MEEIKFYRCDICGNIITKIIDGGPIPFCCGQKMTELIADSSDGAAEKHVPVIEIDGEVVTVKVGEAPHPMIEEHYIQWICLHTEKGVQFVHLNPAMPPRPFSRLRPTMRSSRRLITATSTVCGFPGCSLLSRAKGPRQSGGTADRRRATGASRRPSLFACFSFRVLVILL